MTLFPTHVLEDLQLGKAAAKTQSFFSQKMRWLPACMSVQKDEDYSFLPFEEWYRWQSVPCLCEILEEEKEQEEVAFKQEKRRILSTWGFPEEPPPKPMRPGFPNYAPTANIMGETPLPSDHYQSTQAKAPLPRPGAPATNTLKGPYYSPTPCSELPDLLRPMSSEERTEQERQNELDRIGQALRRQRLESEADSEWLATSAQTLRPDVSRTKRAMHTERTQNGSGDQTVASDVATSEPLYEAFSQKTAPPSTVPHQVVAPEEVRGGEGDQGQTTPQDKQPPLPISAQIAPTLDLDRTNDYVFDNTTQVVRAVMEMVNLVHAVKSDQYINLVKDIGLALKSLLASVDAVYGELPPETHRGVQLAHQVLGSDMSELVHAMRLAQKYATTTLDQDYKRGMLSAGHVLAVDAKNLLDAVDTARLQARRLSGVPGEVFHEES